MRKASADEDWDLFLHAMRSLLCLLDHDTLVTILSDYVKLFIAQYFRTNPQHEHEMGNPLLKVGHVATDNVLTVFDGHKAEPGVNNFRKAVRKMGDLFNLEYCTEEYADTFVSSITNLLIAIPLQSWGTENTSLYNQSLHGTKNEDMLILAIHYNKDPKRIETDKSLKNQLTDYISEYLDNIH